MRADADPSANSQPLRPRAGRNTAIVLWASFLAACMATLVFFAYFDPLLIRADSVLPDWLADRMTGYAVGFFFFWGICTLASALTVLLIATRGNDRAQR
jgi:hypothetical protein